MTRPDTGTGMAELAAALCSGAAAPDALARAGVEDPAAFTRGWAALAGAGSELALASLAPTILGSARPDAALRRLAELSQPTDAPVVSLEAPGAPTLARVLGGADFLARRAARMPDALREVSASASLAPRREADAHARLAEAGGSPRLDVAGRALRRNRYAEMLRITAR
ncbi:MAG TPA: hypothetical protein VKB65_00240, partial [Myxococcota bacterium]|nr:hypothetical protein [Myxococcota bacterium]